MQELQLLPVVVDISCRLTLARHALQSVSAMQRDLNKQACYQTH